MALSRGKHHLIIVGHAENLRRSNLWSNVVSYLEGNAQPNQHIPYYAESIALFTVYNINLTNVAVQLF